MWSSLSLLSFFTLITSSLSKTAVNKTCGISPTRKGFCFFLPRHSGYASIAMGEPAGIAFCTAKRLTLGNKTYSKNWNAAKVFPKNFIQSAHYYSTSKYTQVTGCIDRTPYNLNPKDGGGQWDIVSSNGPPACLGYKYFVSIVEPDIQQYCFRCCHNAKDCDRYHSEYGCFRVIPNGVYKNQARTKNCRNITYPDNTKPFIPYTNTVIGETLTKKGRAIQTVLPQIPQFVSSPGKTKQKRDAIPDPASPTPTPTPAPHYNNNKKRVFVYAN